MTGNWRERGAARWLLAFVVVLMVHGALALALWRWPAPLAKGAPPVAMNIDLAPLPAAPTPPRKTPVDTKVREHVTPPPEPEKPKIKVPEVKKAEAPLPKPKPKPKPKHKPKPKLEPKPEPKKQEKPPEKRDTAPPVMDKQAPKATASESHSGPTPAQRASLEASWHSLIVARLQQYKQYPARARMRRQEGIAYVRFVMNRRGKVLSSEISRGSGSDVLDRATLELLQRAQPLPKPPKDLPGSTFELVVPVNYTLN